MPDDLKEDCKPCPFYGYSCSKKVYETEARLEHINSVWREAGERRKWRMRGLYFMLALLAIFGVLSWLEKGGLL